MNLQNKTSLEIVSLATVLTVIGFIDYLFNLNFTSRLPYPWSLPVQLNSSVNLISFCLFFFMVNKEIAFVRYCSILIIINGFIHALYIIYFDSKYFILFLLNNFIIMEIIQL
jgi:hypothetical protein